MSWLSEFLGTKKIKTPAVKTTEFKMDDYGYGLDAYLRRLSRKKGFEKTIITGQKLPKLGASSYLGAR